VAYEALQCHGGNGFIEENPMARLYREAPLNSVWEGTSNMMCMDVRRAMLKDAACREALMHELRAVRGASRELDRFVDALGPTIDAMLEDEFFARPACEALARGLQAVELLRHSTADVVDGFVATRLGGGAAGGALAGGALFGTLGRASSQARADAIVDRARVAR
jgi:putative acyl-CoA dehydrogenase